MNNDLLFDFNVDKAAKTVYITREFNAGQSLVWDAFTKAKVNFDEREGKVVYFML